MILKLRKNTTEAELEALIAEIRRLDCDVQVNRGTIDIVIGILGDVTKIDDKMIEQMEVVDSISRISAPYKLASREFHPQDTVVKIGDNAIGDGSLAIIAGPCSVETELQMKETTKYINDVNIKFLRGGIVKPRTSPYAFQGLRGKGLDMLEKARDEYGFSIVVELMTIEQIEEFGPRIDVIQIGARNMQNFDLLKAAGAQNKPILLKRGLSATIEEWLMSAEYIMSQGNPNVILCERGIRTFETAYRNVTDLNAIPMLKKLTHLPVVVDPSHATGKTWMVKDIALASIAAGADGIMLETHFNPEIALSDGPQSLREDDFRKVVEKSYSLANFLASDN